MARCFCRIFKLTLTNWIFLHKLLIFSTHFIWILCYQMRKWKHGLQFFYGKFRNEKKKRQKQFWLSPSFDIPTTIKQFMFTSYFHKFTNFLFTFCSPPPTPPPRGLKRDTSKGCLVAAAVGRRIVRQQLNSTLSKAR